MPYVSDAQRRFFEMCRKTPGAKFKSGRKCPDKKTLDEYHAEAHKAALKGVSKLRKP